VRVLGSDRVVVETGGDGVGGDELTGSGLDDVGRCSMDNPNDTFAQCRCG
jgi:hypothetical protein